ncbi:GNAT family N-acetyltransferase [Glycomyces halotolerans]
MQIHRLDPADTALVDRLHAMKELARRSDTPELAPVPAPLFAGELAHPPPGAAQHDYVALDDTAVVGHLHLYLPTRDNRHYAEADITVHPERRRRGIGTALLERLLQTARAENRRELNVVARTAWNDGPTRSHAGPRFLEHRGFTKALTEVDRRLELAALDDDTLHRLWEPAAAAATDTYEILTWTGRTPERHLEPLCRMDSMIFDEIPLGELDIDRSDVDIAHRRVYDDHHERLGFTVLRAVAVHRDGGDIVANTELFGYDGWNHSFQGITIVDPAHRGHRLGLLVKLANLRRFRRRFHRVIDVWTGNADVNTHMIAINEQLGYRPVDARVSYKLQL